MQNLIKIRPLGVRNESKNKKKTKKSLLNKIMLWLRRIAHMSLMLVCKHDSQSLFLVFFKLFFIPQPELKFMDPKNQPVNVFEFSLASENVSSQPPLLKIVLKVLF